jgi:hypothetical protein
MTTNYFSSIRFCCELIIWLLYLLLFEFFIFVRGGCGVSCCIIQLFNIQILNPVLLRVKNLVEQGICVCVGGS